MIMSYEYSLYCKYKQIEQEYRFAECTQNKRLMAKAAAKVTKLTKQLLKVDLLKMINDEVNKLSR